MQVSTRIPHKGWVSVAIVNPKNLFLVGDPLVSFETDSVSGYAVAPVDMDFNVTIPMDLGGRCAVPGDCVSYHCSIELRIEDLFELSD